MSVPAALTWLATGLSGLLAFVTLLPFLKTGHWVARSCDFPRLQILALCSLPGLLIVLTAAAEGWNPLRVGVCVALGAVAIWQFSHIAHYTRFWPREVADDTVGEPLTALIVNLDYQNARKAEVLEALQRVRTDLLLLIEIDESWEKGLEDLRAAYPHREGVVQGDGLGILLLSKLPLRDVGVETLVSKKRASIHAGVELDGERVEIVALHPAPPGLKDENGDRLDSRMRDAELVLVAKDIQQSPPAHRIVMGDLNDVAWSHTTRLFRRLSGLRDPRIGRRLLNTYHARKPLLRYPLDHVFVSDELSVSLLARVRIPGSDHFGVLATIHVPRGEKPEDSSGERATNGDEREAGVIVEEGREDAAESDT